MPMSTEHRPTASATFSGHPSMATYRNQFKSRAHPGTRLFKTSLRIFRMHRLGVRRIRRTTISSPPYEQTASILSMFRNPSSSRVGDSAVSLIIAWPMSPPSHLKQHLRMLTAFFSQGESSNESQQGQRHVCLVFLTHSHSHLTRTSASRSLETASHGILYAMSLVPCLRVTLDRNSCLQWILVTWKHMPMATRKRRGRSSTRQQGMLGTISLVTRQ